MRLQGLFRLCPELPHQPFDFTIGEGKTRLRCRPHDVLAQGFGVGWQFFPVVPQMAFDYSQSHDQFSFRPDSFDKALARTSTLSAISS